MIVRGIAYRATRFAGSGRSSGSWFASCMDYDVNVSGRSEREVMCKLAKAVALEFEERQDIPAPPDHLTAQWVDEDPAVRYEYADVVVRRHSTRIEGIEWQTIR